MQPATLRYRSSHLVIVFGTPNGLARCAHKLMLDPPLSFCNNTALLMCCNGSGHIFPRHQRLLIPTALPRCRNLTCLTCNRGNDYLSQLPRDPIPPGSHNGTHIRFLMQHWYLSQFLPGRGSLHQSLAAARPSMIPPPVPRHARPPK